MSTFLLRLAAAWRFLRTQPFFPEADLPDFWTPEDARSLASFFNGYTGNKLKIRLNNYAMKTAVWATEQKSNQAHSCGIAVGIADVLSTLDAYATISPVGAKSDESEEQRAQTTLADLEGLTV
jgi:hypothetical protein